jgi:hypothetical protein
MNRLQKFRGQGGHDKGSGASPTFRAEQAAATCRGSEVAGRDSLAIGCSFRGDSVRKQLKQSLEAFAVSTARDAKTRYPDRVSASCPNSMGNILN